MVVTAHDRAPGGSPAPTSMRRNAMTSAAMRRADRCRSAPATQCQTRGRPRVGGHVMEFEGMSRAATPALPRHHREHRDRQHAARRPLERRHRKCGAMSSMELTTMFSSRRNTAGSARKNGAGEQQLDQLVNAPERQVERRAQGRRRRP